MSVGIPVARLECHFVRHTHSDWFCQVGQQHLRMCKGMEGNPVGRIRKAPSRRFRSCRKKLDMSSGLQMETLIQMAVTLALYLVCNLELVYSLGIPEASTQNLKYHSPGHIHCGLFCQLIPHRCNWMEGNLLGSTHMAPSHRFRTRVAL